MVQSSILHPPWRLQDVYQGQCQRVWFCYRDLCLSVCLPHERKDDDTLPWPFTEKVTITLLNQLEDENHYKHTSIFRPDGNTSRRVVDGERAPSGYGFPRFILHDHLHYNVVISSQYLKGDCLYLQVKSEPEKPWLT